MAIPKSHCLSCKTLLWDDEPPVQPKSGYPAICIFCGNIMKYDNNLNLVEHPNPGFLLMLQANKVKRVINSCGNTSINEFLKKTRNDKNYDDGNKVLDELLKTGKK